MGPSEDRGPCDLGLPEVQYLLRLQAGKMNFGEAIKRRREEMHFSQERLADRSGLGVLQIDLIEKGHRRDAYLSPNRLIDLHEALDVDFDKIWGEYSE